MTSGEQVNRIVSLVADMTRRSRQGIESASLDELAREFNASKGQVQSDIRALTLLGEDPDAEWLLSLSVWQEGNQVSLASGGPFQRPIRFTGDELIAVQLGLAAVDEPAQAMVSSFASLLGHAEPVHHAMAGRGRVSLSITNLVRSAVTDRRKLEIRYTGERSLGGINRVIHPYQLLDQEGHVYIVAWCEVADGWRHFRLDRILDALPAEGHYLPRPDFVPADDSFAPPSEGTTAVQVRFSPAISRWLKERFADAVTQDDGSLVVTYLVANPEWLLRQVLQYGPEAEIISPPSFRELMRREL